MRPWTGMALGALLALASQSALASPEEARRWLARMTEALATRNYDGLFTHSTAAQSETMRIVHRMENGRSLERLVSLDGSGREIIRTREEVHAYLPDRRVVLVEPRTDKGSLVKALPAPGARLDTFYEVEIQKGQRLLGREVQVVEIRPKDSFRYGYRLWLDRETAMPLRSVVGDGRGRPVEQIIFSRLEIKDRIAAADTQPAVDATGFRWIRNEPGQARYARAVAPGWRPTRVPPGFSLVTSRLQAMPGSPMPAQHLIFSDGVAAISIFIEPGAGPAPAGAAAMGSANMFTTRIEGHAVTAVGEVPADTVRQIATSIVPVSAPTPAESPVGR